MIYIVYYSTVVVLFLFQTANTCPVDRISFAVIHQRQCPGGDIQKKVIFFSSSVLKDNL